MNRLYKILLILVVALASCNPMKDINKQMEENAPQPKATFNYTLTDADYSSISSAALKDATSHADSLVAENIKTTSSLPEGYAANYVPAIIESLHPSLGNGSSANVTYRFYTPLTSLEQYTSADQYTLSNADYTSMGGDVANYGTFSPSDPPAGYVPDFLKVKFANAVDSTLEFVTYNYADTKPTAPPPIFDEEFNGSLGSFTPVNISGTQVWYSSSYGNDEFAKMSGYSGGAQANEDWLVSPQIDLSGYSNPCFQVNQTANYVSGHWEYLQVMVSTDYTGDVTTATWTPVTINTLPTGSDYNFVESEKVDLSGFAGDKIYIAFKYTSTSSVAATWEINWFKVYSTTTTTAIGKQSAFYRLLNGTWKLEPGIYALSSDDYNSMGAPGHYDNFSSSENPDNYLPQYLTMKYPYAQEGDQENIAYMYYSGGVHLRVDQYTFTNSAWTKYDPVSVKSSQFLNNGSKWVFDPTIYFTMSSADYQLIVDAVNADPNLKQYVDSYGTGEYYYGANSHYSDFDARVSQRTDPAFDGLDEAQAKALITQRIEAGIIVMLQAKFPDAVAKVSGIDVNYVVTYWVYENDGSNSEYTATFKCIQSAVPSTNTPAEFELVGKPTKD